MHHMRFAAKMRKLLQKMTTCASLQASTNHHIIGPQTHGKHGCVHVQHASPVQQTATAAFFITEHLQSVTDEAYESTDASH